MVATPHRTGGLDVVSGVSDAVHDPGEPVVLDPGLGASLVADLVADLGPTVTPDEFRHAFRQMASTVAILTLVDRQGRPRGMTATSMCALSVDPPSLLVCVDRSTRTHRELDATDRFGVDVLADDQHHVAVHCARHGANKILPTAWLAEPLTSGRPPAIRGVVARIDCSIEAIHPASTHDIVIGRIDRIEVFDGRTPLLYHDGAFDRLAGDRVPPRFGSEVADEWPAEPGDDGS